MNVNILGLIFGIASAMCWGLTYTISEKILTKTSSISLIFIESLLAAIITLPLFIFKSGGVRSLALSGTTNIVLLLVSVVTAVLGYIFIYESIRLVGASIATIFEIGYPLFVVIFSFFLFGHTLNWYCLLGAVLIMSGALIIAKFC